LVRRSLKEFNVSSTLILAAVDGSPASVAALRWALGEAHTHHRHLQVITVYAPDATEEAQARATQAELIERLLGEETTKHEVTELATEVVAGDPVDVLITWSAHAGLLVLGRHGTQSLVRNALGSVGDACSRLAFCPVVIVPPSAKASPDDSLAVAGT
jgi:nucleotide-binding universal stress UspA family protein